MSAYAYRRGSIFWALTLIGVGFLFLYQNFNAAENGSLAELLDREARGQVETGRTEDHKEAARAFVEKRAPVFAGR